MHGRSNGGRDDGSKLSANYADGSNCANYSSYESLRSLNHIATLYIYRKMIDKLNMEDH
ncbi:hypothetical protein ALC53_02479 [Atta colombica]|uniref:Uncharacterized protein n=1 Tax=Atta colombica TaxID=520822 RepID=A0A195BQT5_9HYME|nr:hypothetical protein ALC53_02479 [Atta colombica]